MDTTDIYINIRQLINILKNKSNMGDGERGSSELITIHIYCQQNLME